MSLTTQFAASIDPVFQNLIQAAIIQQAIAITNELPTVADHTNRVRLAYKILLNPSGYVLDFAGAVASQAIDKTATDAAILNMVSTVWNSLADGA